jgi:hypothetical protein
MPSELNFCKTQVLRMTGMFGAGRLDKNAWDELGKSLNSVARSDQEAREIVDTCLTERSQVPTPHDLIGFGRSRIEQTKQPASFGSRDCDFCYGTGREIVHSADGMYSGVKDTCRCREKRAS